MVLELTTAAKIMGISKNLHTDRKSFRFRICEMLESHSDHTEEDTRTSPVWQVEVFREALNLYFYKDWS